MFLFFHILTTGFNLKYIIRKSIIFNELFHTMKLKLKSLRISENIYSYKKVFKKSNL